MKEYVSLQAVLDIASQYFADDDGSCSKADVDLREMLDEIEALPAADVQPVTRGRWELTNNPSFRKCSECGKKHDRDVTNFCPHCGARMEQEG